MSTRWTTLLDGTRLRELRRTQGLSRAALARQAGIPQPRWPGSPAPAQCRGRTMARLAAALGEPLAALGPAPEWWPEYPGLPSGGLG